MLEYLVSLLDNEEPDQVDMEVEEAKVVPKSTPTKTLTKTDTKKASTMPSRSSEKPKSRAMSSKSEKEGKKKEEKEADAKQKEDVDDISLAIPAILNFISGYFLSKTPQNMDLTEFRQKRAEKRKVLQQQQDKSKHSKQQDLLKDDYKGAKDTKIEGFKQDVFIKKDDLKDENGNTSICSFARTKRNYANQHWYMCYTCGLTRNEGVCNICAKTCHKGHEVVYCKMSSFFCDCQFKSKCVSLPDEYKEGAHGPKADFGFDDFSYERSPFADQVWRREGGRGRGRGLFGEEYRAAYRGMPRGGRRGGRGRSGRPTKEERKMFDVYRKSKKRAAKAHKIKSSDAKTFLSNWQPGDYGGPEMVPANAFLSSIASKKAGGSKHTGIPKRALDSSSESDKENGSSLSSESEESDDVEKELKGQMNELAPKKRVVKVDDEDQLEEEDEIMLYDDLLESERLMAQLNNEDMAGIDQASKMAMLDDIMAARRAKQNKLKKVAQPGGGDEGEDDGEGEDDEEGEEEEDELIFPSNKPPGDLFEENDEVNPPLIEDVEEDKRMDYPEEDYKSMSSIDAKMEKEASPKGYGEGKELEPVEEQNEDEQKDIVMGVDNEEPESPCDKEPITPEPFLNVPKPQNETFKNSKCKEEVPKKLLDKFHELLKRIKNRLRKSGKGDTQTKQVKGNRDKLLKNVAEPEKKITFSNSLTITKRNLPANTIKMSSKAGDDGFNNLLMGAAGHTNYQIPKN